MSPDLTSTSSRQMRGMAPVLLGVHSALQGLSCTLAQGALSQQLLKNVLTERGVGAFAHQEMLAQNKVLFQEALRRHQAFMQGVHLYHKAPRPPTPVLPDPFWQCPQISLHDCGRDDLPKGAPTALFVPSLLNQSGIFDLLPQQSLFAYLRTQGIRPLLLKWRDEEQAVCATLNTYVDLLTQALKAAAQKAPQGLHLAGYCMGGVLCLGAAFRTDVPLKGLALLATPWDFQSSFVGMPMARLRESLKAVLDPYERVPSQILQLLFHLLEPFTIQRKFQNLARLGAQGMSPSELFIAVEDWLCDLRPLPWSVFQECMQDWYEHNLTFTQQQVAGKTLALERLRNLFVVIPQQDKVVSPESAHALVPHLTNPQVLTPNLGHVGILVSQKAPKLVWHPLAEWIKKTSVKQRVLKQGVTL